MKSMLTSMLLLGFFAITSHAQPTARQWNSEIKAGWNLGNQFESCPIGQDSESVGLGDPDGADNAETAWGNPLVTKKIIKGVRDAGFDAIRIPIRWQWHINNPAAMVINKNWMNRIKEVINWCLDYDLKVIINVHHDKWLESRPYYNYKDENCQKLALLWMNIANELKDYDYRVAFAGTNEVHEPNNWERPNAEYLAVQNAYNQTFVDIVRATGGKNIKRNLIVQTYVCNPYFGIDNGDFIIPTDFEGNGNNYMSGELHYYNPWEYAGGCDFYYWGEPYSQYGVPQSNEKTMTEFFDRVANEWGGKGLGIVIGEWGVTNHFKGNEADRIHENMTYYCKTLVSEARKRGFSTFVWDNNSTGNGPEKFAIFDRARGMRVVAPWVLNGIKEGAGIKSGK